MLTTTNLRAWLDCLHGRLVQEKDQLNALDTAIGDADHGSNLLRGFQKVQEKLHDNDPPDIPALCKLVGMTLISTVGGASGPLYGTFFLEAGKSIAAGSTAVAPESFATALASGLRGIQRLGKAELGDKTMVDALSPAIDALLANQSPAAAAQAARAGLAATIPLVARKGRASYLGERSRGHADPGAASAALLFDCLATATPSS
jgi:dihydroxyacetone kinase-like protein